MELRPYEYREDFFVYRHDGDYLGNIQPGSLFPLRPSRWPTPSVR